MNTMLLSILEQCLSNAMLNQPVWGIYGYSHESAIQIMTNLLLWTNR